MPRNFILYPLSFILLFTGCTGGLHGSERNTSFVHPPWKHTWGVVRATPFKLRLFVGNETRFNDPQGIALVRLDSWDDPAKESDDDEITAYGVNSGDNCIIYNRSMYSLGIYSLEREQQKLKHPWGIAANARGDVYIADRGSARVVRLFNPGKDLQFVGELGGSGDRAGMFLDPCGVALDSRGRLYVTDGILDRVTVFDDSGRVVDVWKGFDEPDAIAVTDPGEPWSYYRNDGFAVVVDSLHRRVRKLSLDGELLAETTAEAWGVRDAKLAYIALDYYNQIIITDRDNDCLHKLDRDLNHLTSFGESGKGDYQFREPRGIAIYRRFGQIIVAERAGAQYLWVGVDVEGFSAEVKVDSIWRELRIDFTLTEPAYADLDVVDKFDRIVARLVPRRRFGTGTGSLVWGMTLPKHSADVNQPALPPEYTPGGQLPDGEYTLKGRFRATYSSREDFDREVAAKFGVKW